MPKKKAKLPLSKTHPKLAKEEDGYSEAWSKSTFPVRSIKELIYLTEEFEGNK